MEKKEPVSIPVSIEVSAPSLFSRAKRMRKHYTFTLSEETIKVMDAMIADGEAPNMSRAIDILAKVYTERSNAILVRLNSPHRQLWARHCAARGVLPGDATAELVREALGRG